MHSLLWRLVLQFHHKDCSHFENLRNHLKYVEGKKITNVKVKLASDNWKYDFDLKKE